LGILRIKRNLELKTNDVVDWCKLKIKQTDSIYKKGKNWYVSFENCVITINAHRMKKENDLLNNFEKIHSTELGILRIKRNLELETNDIVDWCKHKIKQTDSIYKKGKNWYVSFENCVITINAHSYTIITAHKNGGNLK